MVMLGGDSLSPEIRQARDSLGYVLDERMAPILDCDAVRRRVQSMGAKESDRAAVRRH
jgi:hypothetical protein